MCVGGGGTLGIHLLAKGALALKSGSQGHASMDLLCVRVRENNNLMGRYRDPFMGVVF